MAVAFAGQELIKIKKKSRFRGADRGVRARDHTKLLWQKLGEKKEKAFLIWGWGCVAFLVSPASKPHRGERWNVPLRSSEDTSIFIIYF